MQTVHDWLSNRDFFAGVMNLSLMPSGLDDKFCDSVCLRQKTEAKELGQRHALFYQHQELLTAVREHQRRGRQVVNDAVQESIEVYQAATSREIQAG